MGWFVGLLVDGEFDGENIRGLSEVGGRGSIAVTL